MINYTEKGAGLHDAITAAGHVLREENGVWVSSDDAAVQAIIDAYDPVAVQREALRAAVAADRIARQQLGIPYTFPDGKAGTIQTRDTQDLTNINGVATNAMLSKAAGVVDPVLPFRDEENETHMLTPDQAIALALAVASYVGRLYQAKWAHDSAIPAWDGSTAYDTLAFWPAV